MHIRLLHTPPRDGADNMAVDDALLDRARATGEVVLRVYAWAAPTLSFGRHQRTTGVYDPARLAARGITAVRRPTGGRAVLHAREVTYSVTAPAGVLAPAGGPVRASYARINAALLAGLRTLGVCAEEARPAGHAPRPDGAPCFEVPTGGELVLRHGDHSRKLVGSAQWQDDGALLQHGSILVHDDQTSVSELATPPLPAVPAPATLRAALGRAPSVAEVADALFGAAALLAPGDVGAPVVSRLSAADLAALDASAAARRAHYADPAWTWRR